MVLDGRLFKFTNLPLAVDDLQIPSELLRQRARPSYHNKPMAGDLCDVRSHSSAWYLLRIF